LRAIMGRQMDRSRLSLEANPHMGLGFAHHTTVTSPLRKYNDLMIHRIISALLDGETPPAISQDELQALQERQSRARIAASQAEFWMKLDWLQQQDQTQTLSAVIVHATSQQMTVRLEEYGIEGQVDRRKAKGKWTFDSKSMSHIKGDERFDIGQVLNVKIQEVDAAKRQLRFVLA